MELKVKKWKEKDSEGWEVKWMFKGWNLLRTVWGPLGGQVGEANVRLHGPWAPGGPELYSIYFPCTQKEIRTTQALAKKEEKVTVVGSAYRFFTIASDGT